MPGRPPAPDQGADAKAHAEAERQRYQNLPPHKRREVVRNRDREAQQAADARRYERDKPQRLEAGAQRQAARGNTDEVKARSAVALALSTGRLKAPATCQNCGKAAKLEAHHADHSKPLDVTFLCPTCHGKTYQTTGSA